MLFLSELEHLSMSWCLLWPNRYWGFVASVSRKSKVYISISNCWFCTACTMLEHFFHIQWTHYMGWICKRYCRNSPCTWIEMCLCHQRFYDSGALTVHPTIYWCHECGFESLELRFLQTALHWGCRYRERKYKANMEYGNMVRGHNANNSRKERFRHGTLINCSFYSRDISHDSMAYFSVSSSLQNERSEWNAYRNDEACIWDWEEGRAKIHLHWKCLLCRLWRYVLSKV